MTVHARIAGKGLFACCESNLKDADGKPVNIEVSAAVWDRRRLVFGSDKNIPGDGRSPVFSMAVDEGRPLADTLEYYTADLIRSADKYEDFALTEDGAYIVATTGFDRVDGDGGAGKDTYNRLLVWPCREPEKVQLVAESVKDGVPSSVRLRDHFSAVLGGVPYFKVEGLASVPGGDGDGGEGEGSDPLLLFGIREVGEDHDHFEYVAKIVAVPYRVAADGSMTLEGDFKLVYEFDPQRFEEVRFPVGLSSLEWDPLRRRLYLLTSFEVKEGKDGGKTRDGAYLWSLSLENFRTGRKPELVRDKEKSVTFEFQDKAEGLAVLPNGLVFVAYDPDRELELDDQRQDKRGKHEAPYTLIELFD